MKTAAMFIASLLLGPPLVLAFLALFTGFVWLFVMFPPFTAFVAVVGFGAFAWKHL